MDWSEAKDAEGRTYYYNSKTQETSWDRPVAMGAAPQSTGDWKEVKTDDGKTYYHNASTNATQWDPPAGFKGNSGSTSAPVAPSTAAKRTVTAAASTVPQTTEEKLAQRARKFIAARRQERARAQPSACASIIFFMVFTSLHNSLKMHPTHLSFSDARKKSAGLLKYPTGTPASAVPKSKGSTVPSLPNGWSSAVDPGSGKEYFFSSDGQTSWERPTAPP